MAAVYAAGHDRASALLALLPEEAFRAPLHRSLWGAIRRAWRTGRRLPGADALIAAVPDSQEWPAIERIVNCDWADLPQELPEIALRVASRTAWLAVRHQLFESIRRIERCQSPDEVGAALSDVLRQIRAVEQSLRAIARWS